MVDAPGVPRVGEMDSMRVVIPEITSKGLGFAGVFDTADRLIGVVTDGDLRRNIQAMENFLDATAQAVMTPTPMTIPSDLLAVEALRMMEDHQITSLFVVDPAQTDRVNGVIHIHHLVRAGLQ